MDESDAVEAFERLGLTGYEAKVFIALQKVGSGPARDVSEVTDVPRSQVYSAAESLSDRGLVEIQQSSPKQFRPVSVEAARSMLRDRFERESERAFEFVEATRAEGAEETKGDIWTIHGSEGVAARCVELVRDAEESVVFGARGPDMFTDRIERALVDRSEDGVDVTVISLDPAVRNVVAERQGIHTVEPPTAIDNERSGRLLIVDGDTVLVSVVSGASDGDETAVWSSGSNIASVLIQLLEGSLGLD